MLRDSGLIFVAMYVLCATVGAQEITTAPYLPDSGNLVVRCGTLIDGISDKPQSDRVVSIVDGRIMFVRDASDDDRYAVPVLNLAGFTCLPGLIDTHTHITDRADETADLSIYYTRSIEREREISRANAAITLAAGFTTIRNLGAYGGWSGREVRDRINRGEILGPRMQTAGFYLTVPAGGGDLVIPGIDESEIPARVRMGVTRGPAGFQRKAEEAVAGGADVLKVIASGAVLAYGGVPGSPEMSEEEIRAVVDVGHAAGIKVTAHAHGAQSIKDAINAGVDSIEHASLADDEAIEMAVQEQVAFSMDIYNGSYIATAGREQGWPEEFIRKNDETTAAQRQVFTKAYQAGVPIIYGTDAAVYPHGDNAKQFVVMIAHGMSAMDAIKAATSQAARFIGWDDDVGSVAAGRYGDLIAIHGDPLADMSLLQDVDIVIKGGLLFKWNEQRPAE